MVAPGQVTSAQPRLVVTDCPAGTRTTGMVTGVTSSEQSTSPETTEPPMMLTSRSSEPLLLMVMATATGWLLELAGRTTWQFLEPPRLASEVNVRLQLTLAGTTVTVALLLLVTWVPVVEPVPMTVAVLGCVPTPYDAPKK